MQLVLNTTAFAALGHDAGEGGELALAGDAPVLQVIVSGGNREDWLADSQGLRPRDIAMQVALPEMDGRTLVANLRGEHDNAGLFRDLKIIVLTSGDPTADTDLWRDLSISGRLLKPIKQAELLAAVETALGAIGPQHAHAHPPQANVAASNARRLEILLAEDGLTNQRFAVALLSKWGHRVTVASDGRDAIAAWEAQPFDLVLMDVQMPDVDGLEATREIRRREGATGRRTPIMAMTARAMAGDRDQCLAAQR